MKGPTSAGSGLGRLAALGRTLGPSRAGRWRGGRFTPGVNDGGRGGGVRDDTRPSTHGRSTGAEGGPAQISRRRCRGWYSGGPRCAGESGQGRGFFPLPAGGAGRCGGVAEKEAGRRGERVGRVPRQHGPGAGGCSGQLGRRTQRGEQEIRNNTVGWRPSGGRVSRRAGPDGPAPDEEASAGGAGCWWMLRRAGRVAGKEGGRVWWWFTRG